MLNNNYANPEFKFIDQDAYGSIEFISRGAYGSVYKVITKRKEVRALKLIEINDVHDCNKVLKELFILATARHNNILTVCNAEILDKYNYFCMETEYIPNGDLFNYFIKNNKKISENMIKQIIKQISSALQFIYNKHKIIHRDIKLENILIKDIDEDNDTIHVVLADFGLAKKNEMKLSSFSSLLGTHGYLAPEIKEYLNYSNASDVFALGVTLYRLMTLDDTDFTSFYKICSDDDKSKSVKEYIYKQFKNTKYSNELQDVIISMLEYDIDKRITLNDLCDIQVNKNRKEIIQIKTDNSTTNNIINNIINSSVTEDLIIPKTISIKNMSNENIEKLAIDVYQKLKLNPNFDSMASIFYFIFFSVPRENDEVLNVVVGAFLFLHYAKLEPLLYKHSPKEAVKIIVTNLITNNDKTLFWCGYLGFYIVYFGKLYITNEGMAYRGKERIKEVVMAAKFPELFCEILTSFAENYNDKIDFFHVFTVGLINRIGEGFNSIYPTFMGGDFIPHINPRFKSMKEVAYLLGKVLIDVYNYIRLAFKHIGTNIDVDYLLMQVDMRDDLK